MNCWKCLDYFVLYIPGQELHGSDVVGVGLDRLYPDVLPELSNSGILLFSCQAIDNGGTSDSGELAIALLLDHLSHLIMTGLKQGRGRVLLRGHDDNCLELLDGVNYSELVPLIQCLNHKSESHSRECPHSLTQFHRSQIVVHFTL